MAGYSENREQNFEMKYLRKVLSEVDEGIVIPDRVRGSALRARLDDVEPAAPPPPDRRSGINFGMRWLSWQSGLTYVAAFALIVGLFYGLGYHQTDIVERNMVLPNGTRQDSGGISAAVADALPGGEEEAVTEDTDPAPPSAGAQDARARDTDPFAIIAHPQQDPPADEEVPDAFSGSGVGGSGISVRLGTRDGYTWSWRPNDATDPDKGSFPVTVEGIHDESAQVAGSVDIADLETVIWSDLTDDLLVLVGSYGDTVVTRSYDISDPEQPREQTVRTQPGSYVISRSYLGIVHTVSFAETIEDAPGVELETLPHADSQSACVIGAVDTNTGESAVKAFVGATASMDLHDRSALLYYTGVAEEAAEEDGGAAETSAYVAQVRLSRTDISLGSVS